MIGGEKDQLAQFLLSPAPPLSPLAYKPQFKGWDTPSTTVWAVFFFLVKSLLYLPQR